jgi:DNA-binding NtrC family response regulator
MKAELELLVSQMYRRGMRLEEALQEFQSVFILTVLRDNKGNQFRAAKKLGMHRNTLRRTIRSLQLDLLSVRPASRCRPPRGQALDVVARQRATRVGA